MLLFSLPKRCQNGAAASNWCIQLRHADPRPSKANPMSKSSVIESDEHEGCYAVVILHRALFTRRHLSCYRKEVGGKVAMGVGTFKTCGPGSPGIGRSPVRNRQKKSRSSRHGQSPFWTQLRSTLHSTLLHGCTYPRYLKLSRGTCPIRSLALR